MPQYMEKVIIRLLDGGDSRLDCANVINNNLEKGWKVKDIKLSSGGSSNYITAIFVLHKEESPTNIESA